MFIACAFMTAITVTCLIGPAGPDDRAAGAESALRAGDIAARLRAEAAHLETGHASELLAALSDRDTVASLRLSKTQVELAARLDQLARDIQRAWLVRGLDRQPSPPAAEMAERLSERGRRLRTGVVRQAEAIALEGVLEPDQTRRLLGRAGRRPLRSMASGYRSFSVPASQTPPEEKGLADRQIRGWIQNLATPGYQPSELYKVFLGEGERGALGLSDEQTALIRRLERATRDVVRDWLARGLDGPEPLPRDQWEDPAPPRMVQRLSEDGGRLWVNLLLRSEVIALEGVLEPEQAMRSKRRLWSRSGLDLVDARMGGSPGIIALLDPEVAAALRLSKGQRDELAARIEDLKVLAWGLSDRVGTGFSAVQHAHWAKEITNDQCTAAEESLTSVARVQISQAEEPVWDVLSTRQIRAFRRLVSVPDLGHPEKRPAAPKRPR